MQDVSKDNNSLKNTTQVSGFISEGNPNTQEEPAPAAGKPVSSISSDQQSVRMVKQAIHDDQALSAVADDIRVTVKDGTITLAGQVGNEQQMNLATNTAAAFEGVDKLKTKVINNLTIEEAMTKI